jgi:hypothetical protein
MAGMEVSCALLLSPLFSLVVLLQQNKKIKRAAKCIVFNFISITFFIQFERSLKRVNFAIKKGRGCFFTCSAASFHLHASVACDEAMHKTKGA